MADIGRKKYMRAVFSAWLWPAKENFAGHVRQDITAVQHKYIKRIPPELLRHLRTACCKLKSSSAKAHILYFTHDRGWIIHCRENTLLHAIPHEVSSFIFHLLVLSPPDEFDLKATALFTSATQKHLEAPVQPFWYIHSSFIQNGAEHVCMGFFKQLLRTANDLPALPFGLDDQNNFIGQPSDT